MSNKLTKAVSLQDRIETIEEAFEFMMAFAAQGLEQEDPNEGGGIRSFLTQAVEALNGLHDVASEQAQAVASIGDDWVGFLAVLKADADRAQTLIEFTLAQPNLNSELIDNLNATNHIRTLLTDVFLLDSAFGTHKNSGA